MNRALLPLLAFIILVVFLGIGLTKDPRKLPSTFIGKTAPELYITKTTQTRKNNFA